MDVFDPTEPENDADRPPNGPSAFNVTPDINVPVRELPDVSATVDPDVSCSRQNAHTDPASATSAE